MGCCSNTTFHLQQSFGPNFSLISSALRNPVGNGSHRVLRWITWATHSYPSAGCSVGQFIGGQVRSGPSIHDRICSRYSCHSRSSKSPSSSFHGIPFLAVDARWAERFLLFGAKRLSALLADRGPLPPISVIVFVDLVVRPLLPVGPSGRPIAHRTTPGLRANPLIPLGPLLGLQAVRDQLEPSRMAVLSRFRG